MGSMNSGRKISWFSCGAASAVATGLASPDVIAYCETGAEHPDNERFLSDCEHWFGRNVIRLHSREYADTWDVFEKTRWLAGINGARCTTELKVVPRLEYQNPDDRHVFGYTADRPDMKRAERMAANYPELKLEFPLIERNLTKAACLALIGNAGISPPAMYGLGFSNNNCIPCVKASEAPPLKAPDKRSDVESSKATSAAYWALVRKEFPGQFQRMVKLSRELGVRLCRIRKDGVLVRAFIDEIPEEHPVTDPVQPDCDFLCHLAEQDFNDMEREVV